MGALCIGLSACAELPGKVLPGNINVSDDPELSIFNMTGPPPMEGKDGFVMAPPIKLISF